MCNYIGYTTVTQIKDRGFSHFERQKKKCCLEFEVEYQCFEHFRLVVAGDISNILCHQRNNETETCFQVTNDGGQQFFPK